MTNSYKLLKRSVVLYIENDIDTKIIKQLKSNVKDLYTADNGIDALAIFMTKKPTIVITDTDVKEIDGLTILKEIRKIHTDAIVVFLTSNTDSEILVKSIEYNVSSYLIKPISNELILQKIELLLQNAHSNCLISTQDKLIEKCKIVDENILLNFTDLDGNIRNSTKAFQNFTGYNKDEILTNKHTFHTHYLEEDYVANIWKSLNENKQFIGEVKCINKAGVNHWTKIIIDPIFDQYEKKSGYSVITEDISNQKSLESLSITDTVTDLYNRRYFNELFQNELTKVKVNESTFGLLIIDIDFFKQYNDSYGHLAGDIALFEIAKTIKNIESVYDNYTFRLGGEEFGVIVSNIDFTNLKKYADNVKESVTSLNIEHKSSKISDYLTVSIGAVYVDKFAYNYSVSDIYNIADENLYRAKNAGRNNIKINSCLKKDFNDNEIDTITKLHTRVKLAKDINSLNSQAMLILLFINDFSHLNEQYGNKFIDNVLVNKANDLNAIILDASASTYRLNVNEFALLITNKTQFERYFSLLKYSILNNEKYDLEDKSASNITISLTAGVAYGKEQILRNANIALHKAFNNTNNYYIYEDKDNKNNEIELDRLKYLNIYQEALANDNIVPYFQPIVDAKTEYIYKYEALARIIDKDKNIITPNHFLNIAKEDKTFENLTRQLLQKIFNIYSYNEIHISINLTYENISSMEIVSYIKNRLDKYGGERITFEIIESEEIVSYDIVSDFISTVKEYGCKIAIDDFGNGYSNFTNLIKLDIDYIKIDGSIIKKILTHDNVELMTKSLISYARNTNIKTIAEYVFSEEIADKVKELDVDLLQGYYYGEPKSAIEYGLNI